MLFSLSHGQHAIEARLAPRADAPATVPLHAVAPDAPSEALGARSLEMAGASARRSLRADPGPAPAVEADPPAPLVGKFRYYFPDAPGLPEDPAMPGWLDALADSMVADPAPAPPDPGPSSLIPPVFTYLGQFIDHDVTANTDRETAISVIDGAIAPLPRAQVEAGVLNLRDGSLALDSLYGDATGSHAFAAKLAGLMRAPGNRAMMRLNKPLGQADGGGGRVPLPALPDEATDLLRLGFLLRRGDVTLAEIEALEPELRSVFLNDDGTPNVARAVIGDARNDENLVVAQLHVLFLRLHNKLAEATGSRSFARARRLTQWHYQWLVVNSYLATVCDSEVLDEIVSLGAPRYAAFVDAHGTTGPKMPMPLEFSVAAFRFGHSMVRAAYDHNRFFGEPVPGTPALVQPVAPFPLLFGFTGNGRMRPVPTAPASPTGRLPQNWVIEWDRWLRVDPAHPVRAARLIDTDIAPPLQDMANEHPDPASLFRRLGRRNLRRGYRLNLPTAQGAIAAVEAAGYKALPRLTPEQIREGGPARAKAVTDGGFDVATPLWFYVLKEAEVLGQGQHLGPLGSHLVAETLVGLIASDPDSYWNADGGRWSPDRFRAQDPIDSLEAMARFCGML